MIDLNNLIDLFPYYYKENDSYKVDGKGLLERFLNICGDYFQKHPLADLDNFLEILDINKTNIIFVNNFWKFFGELPFAQGPVIDPELFQKAFTGFNFDEAIKQATVSNEAYTGVTNVDYRSIITYAVSLFKIRGTRQFFDIMFRLYGMNVQIQIPEGEDPFQKDHTTHFDLEDTQFDKVTFDNYYRCQNCSDVTFLITLPANQSSKKQSEALSYINQVRSFIERFVPFYINPVIQVYGNALYNTVTIKVDKTKLTLSAGETGSVIVTVAPSVPGNTLVPLTYRVAVTDSPDIIPKPEDWSIETYLDPEYKIPAAGKTYWFKPTASTLSSTPSVQVKEVYTTSQYMIWVDSPIVSPDNPLAATLSKDQTSITVKVKARLYTFTYEDGEVVNTKETKPTIKWDTAPEGASSVFMQGEAQVTVDYYGRQIFSILNFPTRKTFIDIEATEDYKKELDSITLSLDPQYILIKDNTFTPGSLNAEGQPDTPGIYQSPDGSTWKPLDNYQTVFKVVNREGQVQPDANVFEVSNLTKIYHSGEAFEPPTKGTSTFTFKATLGQVESEPVTLHILTQSSQVFNPIPISIQIFNNPWYFSYSSGEVTSTTSGEVVVSGLSKTSAYNYVPKIQVKSQGLDENIEQTINGVFQEYKSGKAYYKFDFSHTIKSDKSHKLIFSYTTESGRTIKTEVPVEIEKVETNIYIETEDKLDQWTVNQGDSVSGKAAAKRGTELTFKAKPGKGNNIAIFTIKGTGIFSVDASNGKTYDVNSETPIEIEVNKTENITFTSGSTTLTLHLVDYEGIVNISCSPTTATINAVGQEVSTTVTGDTNKSDTFRFTIDDTSAIREIPNHGAYEFKTSVPGTHTFRAVDNQAKVATFIVNSTVRTDVEVTEDELTWAHDETSAKVIQIIVPSNVKVTITEE